MKKLIRLLTALVCAVALGMIFAGCADVNGLHNQKSSNVTIVFTNFTAASDGDYTLPGDYTTGTGGTWTSNTTTMLTMKSGEGTSSTIVATSPYLYFTLVKTNSWTRQWVSSVKGNAVDNTTGVYQNFYAEVAMGTDVTVTVDGSTSPVTVTVK